MKFSTLAIIMFLFQQVVNPTPSPVPLTTNHWYENPTIIVAILTPILGLISGLIMFKVNKWWDKKQAERKEEKEEEEIHNSLFAKFAEMNKDEKAELRALMMTLHAQEIEWYKKQLEMKDALILKETTDAHTARDRAHAFASENTRLQTHIIVLQGLMAQGKTDIPSYTFTPYTDLMINSLNNPEKKQLAEQFIEKQLEIAKTTADEDKKG